MFNTEKYDHNVQVATRQECILLVDDNPMLRELGKECLLLKGFSVLLAKDGEEALFLVAKHRIDLILMDIQMPVLDGIDATKRLRALGKKLPVIAMTAKANDSYNIELIQMGFIETPCC